MLNSFIFSEEWWKVSVVKSVVKMEFSWLQVSGTLF